MHWGALPIANYTSDRGLDLGVLAQRFDYGQPGRRPFESLLSLQASYAVQGPRLALIEWETVGAGARLHYQLYAVSSRFERYYGLGASSLRDGAREAEGFNFYSRESASALISVRRELLPSLEARVGARVFGHRLEPVSSQSQFAADFGGGSSTAGAQLITGLILERRDFEFIPSEGNYAELSASFAPGLGAGEAWGRFDFDYRRYTPVLSERRLWLAAQARYSASSVRSPLPEKARLGGPGTLRGLPLGRYVANHSMSARAELRSVWFRERLFGLPLKIGSGVFADFGWIGDSPGQAFASGVHKAWGANLFGSYFTDDFLGSADLGFSEGTTTLYLRLGHAF